MRKLPVRWTASSIGFEESYGNQAGPYVR
jgi:hypothetical protein